MITIQSAPSIISPVYLPIVFNINDDDTTTKFYRVVIRDTLNDLEIGMVKIFKYSEYGTDIELGRILVNVVTTEIKNTTSLFQTMKGTVRYSLDITAIDLNGTSTGTIS